MYRTAMLSFKLEIMVNIFLYKEDLPETPIYVITKSDSAIFGNNINNHYIWVVYIPSTKCSTLFIRIKIYTGFQVYLLTDGLTINFIDIWKTGMQWYKDAKIPDSRLDEVWFALLSCDPKSSLSLSISTLSININQTTFYV